MVNMQNGCGYTPLKWVVTIKRNIQWKQALRLVKSGVIAFGYQRVKQFDNVVQKIVGMTHTPSFSESSGQMRMASAPRSCARVAIPLLSAIGAKKIKLSLGTVLDFFHSDTDGGFIPNRMATALVPPNFSISFSAFIPTLLGIPYLLSIGIPYLIKVRIT